MGHTADGKRNRIFVSYSHRDSEWSQHFKKMLNPALGERLELWSDTDIPVGRPWRHEVIRAIELSTVALLLVSTYFLDSDFIMNEELPALIGMVSCSHRCLWVTACGTTYPNWSGSSGCTIRAIRALKLPANKSGS